MVQLEAQDGMTMLYEEMILPAPRQKLAQAAHRVQQSEVAGGAAVRGSWDRMWCWPESEVQQSEVADSVSTALGAKVRGRWGRGAVSRGSCQ